MTNVSVMFTMTRLVADAVHEDEINRAMSPKGVLQYIINFFTFGGVRRSNDALYHLLEERIDNKMNSQAAIKEYLASGKITLNDVKGNDVTFVLPGINNQDGMVRVIVSKGSEKEEGVVSNKKFTKFISKADDELKKNVFEYNQEFAYDTNELTQCGIEYDYYEDELEKALEDRELFPTSDN